MMMLTLIEILGKVITIAAVVDNFQKVSSVILNTYYRLETLVENV